MSDLIEFLRARLDEDEWWATEASRRYGERPPEGGAHWQWECGDHDEVLTLDPTLGEFLECPQGYGEVSLRSAELYPTTSGVGDLPQFALPTCDEVSPSVAGHIARHDPARVLREVEAKRQILAEALRLVPPNLNVDCGQTVILKALALPYDQHPDYRPEWKP